MVKMGSEIYLGILKTKNTLKNTSPKPSDKKIYDFSISKVFLVNLVS